MCKYRILSNARTSIFKYETISKMVSLSFVRNIPKVTLQVIEAVQAGFPWTNTTTKKNYMVLAKKMQVQEMTRPLTNLLTCSFFWLQTNLFELFTFQFRTNVSLLENNTLMNNALMNKAFGLKLRFLLKFDFSNNFS